MERLAITVTRDPDMHHDATPSFANRERCR
jgi:hypothetical protein